MQASEGPARDIAALLFLELWLARGQGLRGLASKS